MSDSKKETVKISDVEVDAEAYARVAVAGSGGAGEQESGPAAPVGRPCFRFFVYGSYEVRERESVTLLGADGEHREISAAWLDHKLSNEVRGANDG